MAPGWKSCPERSERPIRIQSLHSKNHRVASHAFHNESRNETIGLRKDDPAHTVSESVSRSGPACGHQSCPADFGKTRPLPAEPDRNRPGRQYQRTPANWYNFLLTVLIDDPPRRIGNGLFIHFFLIMNIVVQSSFDEKDFGYHDFGVL